MTTQTEFGYVPEITFGWRMRIARENAGLDQGQLAELTGIARNTISNYEKGQTTRPNKAFVRLIAAALNVNQTWLETGEAGPVTGPGLSLVPALPQDDSNVQPFDYQSRRASSFSQAA